MLTIEAAVYVTILIGVGILTIFIVYFLITTQRQHKLKRRLEKKLLAAEVEMIEKERDRIARDLHDELSPLLASVRFQLIAFEESRNHGLIENSIIGLEQSLKSIRTITSELAPLNLSRKGIWVTLEELTERINTIGPISCCLSVHDQLTLSIPLQIHVFRIINEIVHNCIKHSGASKLIICVTCIKNKLRLVLEDNGIGFDYKIEMEKTGGLGLKNILNRVNFLSGDLIVESKSGTGTYFQIEIPLQNGN
jgi:two-component system NarL family sensor kinase